MTPGVLPPGWVRIQVYLPEEIRYNLRSRDSNLRGDSLMVRNILEKVSKLSDDDFESLLS